MDFCHVLRLVASTAFIGFGILWLCLLQQIRADVNDTIPTNERKDWKWWDEFSGVQIKVQWWRDIRMHWFWDEHVRLFPTSHKRIHCAMCLISAFTIPIACLIACLLTRRCPLIRVEHPPHSTVVSRRFHK